MTERYGIDLLQMMENAGRCLAVVARDRFLGGDVSGQRIVVLAGGGGNGGGGLAAARRLSAWGANVEVHVSRPRNALKPATEHQLETLVRLSVPVHLDSSGHELGKAALVIDAILGYSLAGPPRGNELHLIDAANAQPSPVLALDLPSGLDATTGETPGAVVHAQATLTLALPKTGLYGPKAHGTAGELYLADIGVPPVLYAEPESGFKTNSLFAVGDILRVA